MHRKKQHSRENIFIIVAERLRFLCLSRPTGLTAFIFFLSCTFLSIHLAHLVGELGVSCVSYTAIAISQRCSAIKQTHLKGWKAITQNFHLKEAAPFCFGTRVVKDFQTKNSKIIAQILLDMS
jgi:hypothetical protein